MFGADETSSNRLDAIYEATSKTWLAETEPEDSDLALDGPPDSLGDAVRGARAMGWAGFNCSTPHKVAVIAHVDRLDRSVALIGAVTRSCSSEQALGPFEQQAMSGRSPAQPVIYGWDNVFPELRFGGWTSVDRPRDS